MQSLSRCAGGFVLLVGAPAVLVVLSMAVPRFTDLGYAVARQTVTIADMASILYGLWADP